MTFILKAIKRYKTLVRSGMQVFSVKAPAELLSYVFDFIEDLEHEEVIVGVVSSTMSLVSGPNPDNSSGMLVGTATYSDTKVSQQIQGGTINNRYRWTAVVKTNYGNHYTMTGDIPVVDPSLIN